MCSGFVARGKCDYCMPLALVAVPCKSAAMLKVFFAVRIRSLLHPANPGLTAAEALTAPFFTFDQR